MPLSFFVFAKISLYIMETLFLGGKIMKEVLIILIVFSVGLAVIGGTFLNGIKWTFQMIHKVIKRIMRSLDKP